MTALRWRQAPPDRPGWWWMRHRFSIDGFTDWNEQIVRIDLDEDGLIRVMRPAGPSVLYEINAKKAVEWAGPVEPPCDDDAVTGIKPSKESLS